MTPTDLLAALDRAAVTRVYEVVWRRSSLALQDREPTLARIHHHAEEEAARIAEEMEQYADELAEYLEAMREVTRL